MDLGGDVMPYVIVVVLLLFGLLLGAGPLMEKWIDRRWPPDAR
jgi:hypothetical protein